VGDKRGGEELWEREEGRKGIGGLLPPACREDHIGNGIDGDPASLYRSRPMSTEGGV